MNSINEVLDFAISNEQEAFEFYIKLAEKANTPEMKDAFLRFAEEENSHKEKLLIIKNKGLFKEDFDIQESLIVDETPANEDFNPALTLSYRQALIIAIQKEKVAHKLYTMLAKVATNSYTKSIFLSLAEEEAKHKNRFQQEYDNFIVNNN